MSTMKFRFEKVLLHMRYRQGLKRPRPVAEKILHQIKCGVDGCGNSGLLMLRCWGAHSFVGVENGLVFQVSGAKFKGRIFVVYDMEMDLYHLHLSSGANLNEALYAVYGKDLTRSIGEQVDHLFDSGFELEEAVNAIYREDLVNQ